MNIKDLAKQILGDEDITLNTFNPRNKYVSDHTLLDIIAGENISVWAGPPSKRLAELNPQYLRPIGAANVLSRQYTKQWIPVSEFGHQYYYHLPAKMQYAVSLNKIRTARGDAYTSFYKWLQFHWQDLDYRNKVWVEAPTIEYQSEKPNFVGSTQTLNPGSDLFNLPFGLALYEFDQAGTVLKQQYLQGCKIGTVSGTQTNSPISEDNIQILVSQVLPFRESLSAQPTINYKMPDPKAYRDFVK